MGKLNILHHKSWHVYKRENRERVLKDEAKSKEEEENKRNKKLLDEREERIEKLRQSKGQESAFTLFPQTSSESTQIQKSDQIQKSIKEDPFVMKLGETKSGEKSNPWYSKSNVKEFNSKDQYSPKDLPKSYSSKMTREKDELIKSRQDPLRIIRKDSILDFKKESIKESSNSIQELRRKRLEREKAESIKSLELLTGKKVDSLNKDYKLHEREQDYYHSQFNRDSRRRRM